MTRSVASLGIRGVTAWFFVLVAGAGMGLAVGCGGGGEPASVSGEVTYAGQAVDNGNIRFDATAETASDPAAARIEGGKYQIPESAGLKAGTYRVMISASEVTGTTTDPETGEEVDQVRDVIPEKYNVKSDLTAELSPGENTKDFSLEP